MILSRDLNLLKITGYATIDNSATNREKCKYLAWNVILHANQQSVSEMCSPYPKENRSMYPG